MPNESTRFRSEGTPVSNLTNPAAGASAHAQAYVNALLDALGARDPFDVLRETPDGIRRAIAGMSVAQLTIPEAPGKWSVRHVVQHLADSELVGGYRFRVVLAQNRPPLAGYDQDRWANHLGYEDTDIETALNDFSTLRRANLRLLDRTSPAERQRVGLHAERGEESIAHMMRLYSGHDVVHLRQIARIRERVTGSR
ncbi:MAG: DinB family protein [Gemmatimonadaceae bacterium]